MVFNCFLCLQDVPRCTTIQEQMDPKETFNLLYVTQEFKSYIKVIGDNFSNTSVPMSSKVNLSCFYAGM